MEHGVKIDNSGFSHADTQLLSIAIVIDCTINRHGEAIMRIHFSGWSSLADEWIEMDSIRISTHEVSRTRQNDARTAIYDRLDCRQNSASLLGEWLLNHQLDTSKF